MLESWTLTRVVSQLPFFCVILPGKKLDWTNFSQYITTVYCGEHHHSILWWCTDWNEELHHHFPCWVLQK